MTLLEIVVLKLHNKVDELTCRLAIEEVEQEVKNYCRIDKVPEELRFTVANMAIDLIRYELEAVGEDTDVTQEISIADVASVKMGDTTINLGGGSENTGADRARNSHKANLDDVVMNYRSQLNRFRRMVW